MMMSTTSGDTFKPSPVAHKSLQALEDKLQSVVTHMATKFNLSMDEETLHEIRVHYKNLLNSTTDVIDSLLEPLKQLEDLMEEDLEYTSVNAMCGGDELCQSLERDLVFDSDNSPTGGGAGAGAGNNSWQFWFWKSDQRYPKWDNGLQKLAKPFATVSKLFWIQRQLIDVHEIVIPSDYSLFREHIKPKWEDSTNKDGGSWIIRFERNNIDAALVQEIWDQLLAFVVSLSGHPTVNSHSICGVKISMRFKFYQISLWTKYFHDLHDIFYVGVQMQKLISSLVGKHSKVLDSGDYGSFELCYRAHRISQQNAMINEQTKFGYGQPFFF